MQNFIKLFQSQTVIRVSNIGYRWSIYLIKIFLNIFKKLFNQNTNINFPFCETKVCAVCAKLCVICV